MTISNTLTEKSFAPDAGSNQTFDLGFEVFETSDIVMFFDKPGDCRFRPWFQQFQDADFPPSPGSDARHKLGKQPGT